MFSYIIHNTKEGMYMYNQSKNLWSEQVEIYSPMTPTCLQLVFHQHCISQKCFTFFILLYPVCSSKWLPNTCNACIWILACLKMLKQITVKHLRRQIQALQETRTSGSGRYMWTIQSLATQYRCLCHWHLWVWGLHNRTALIYVQIHKNIWSLFRRIQDSSGIMRFPHRMYTYIIIYTYI